MERRVQIQLHARAAELAGVRTAEVAIAPAATCTDVKQALAQVLPVLRDLVAASVLATETEYLSDGAPVTESALHFIPPVSGG